MFKSYPGKAWFRGKQATDPGPGKPCHFPFKLAKNSSWLHSCVYDKDVRGVDKIWCPTQVDIDGVVVPGKTGTCDDERNTAYAGPGLYS